MRNLKFLACPRCDSTDLYEAPRIVGQKGLATGFDIGDTHIGGVGASKAVEGLVSLCRNCGERAVQKERLMTPEEEEAWNQKAEEGWEKDKPKVIIGLVIFVISLVVIFKVLTFN